MHLLQIFKYYWELRDGKQAALCRENSGLKMLDGCIRHELKLSV